MKEKIKKRLQKRLVNIIFLTLSVIFVLRFIYAVTATSGEKLLFMNSTAGRNLLQMRSSSFMWFLILLAVYCAIKFMTYDPKKN